MTATDELRAMLDERGVEWLPLDGTPDMTECIVDGVRHKYRPVGRGIIWSSCTEVAMKPEQAIAATLGNETCREVKVTTKPNMWGFDDYFCGHCGRRLTSVANGLNEHFPVYCEDCGTKAVYE